MKKEILWVLILTCSISAEYLLPDTLWAKVIFYDFHADGTNPNFEACGGGRRPGMIQDTLDSQRRPILRNNSDCNDRLDEWFRPSGSAGSTFGYDIEKKVWGWTNLVSYKNRIGEWVGSQFDSTYDMANIVIFDSLPLTIFDATTGTYEFVRNKNFNDHQQFFWLDGRGFGEEPEGKNHNFAFSMELHHEFTYHGGEFFEFYGDDDAWVFINGKLVLDLGGLQSEVHGKVDLDQMADKLVMTKGRKYSFDFFYTERHTPQSNCVITTNILTPSKPNQIIVFSDSNSVFHSNLAGGLSDTAITAGEHLNLFAYVVDDTGALRSDWSSNINWEVFDSLGNPLNIYQKSQNNSFFLTEAFGCVTVLMSYQDSLFPGISLFDTVKICVNAGAPDHLVIEASPDSSISLRNDNPLNTLFLSKSESQGEVYAILRDRYGNFSGYATSAQWHSFDTTQVITSVGYALNGEGLVIRKANEGLVEICASMAKFTDTINVVLENITYDSLRIVSGSGVLKDIDTLRIRCDQDTALTALGKRSDNGQWDNVLVKWSQIGLTIETNPPFRDYQWTSISTLQPGNGKIVITRTGDSREITDTVVVISLPGLPQKLVLYPLSGSFGQSTNPYPNPSISIQVAAGNLFPVNARLFDNRGNWLQNYDNYNAPINWRVIELEGVAPTGVLSLTTGASVYYKPRRATNTIYLLAEYDGYGISCSDTVKLKILPGSPDHLVIEGSPDRGESPYEDNPLQLLMFTSIDTSLSIYAVIRDSMGNFISFSQRTSWLSSDSTICSVEAGKTILGEGIVKRVAGVGQNFIVGRNGDDTTLVDTVRAILSKITYDSLRIVTNHGGLKDISVLSMEQGDDTLLFALGLRSDTKIWESVRVSWSSPGIVGSTSAPISASKWAFSPIAASEGIITIKYGMAFDTIKVIVTYPAPEKLILYHFAGQPGNGNLPYISPPLADTVISGESVQIFAKMFSSMGNWLSEFESETTAVTWDIKNYSGLNIISDSLDRKTGAFNRYYPVKAYSNISIVVSYQYKNKLLRDTVYFYVKPGSQHHLVIESSPEWRNSPNADNPIDTIIMGYSDSTSNAYAILRDANGNYIGYSNNATWLSGDTGTLIAGNGIISLGEGRLVRKVQNGSAIIKVFDKAGRNDSAFVRLTTKKYDSLRIISLYGDVISKLSMNVKADTTLMVQGRNVETGVWESVQANWSVEGNVSVLPFPPFRSGFWTFTGADSGSGLIRVTLGAGSSLISSTAAIQLISGKPTFLKLYPKSGSPAFNNQPYPDSVVLQAGSDITVVAKIFDQANVWMSSLENHNAPVIWELLEENSNSGTVIMSDTAGFAVIITPVKAYRTVKVVSIYSSGTLLLSDTLKIRVLPGSAHHLVIEANQNRDISPDRDNPIGSIVFTNKETYRHIYAVIRDASGNWVDYSLITEWKTNDSTVALADNGITSLGEAIISRVNTGTTLIKAVSRNTKYGETIMSDSVQVIVKDMYYQKLRIVNGMGIPLDSLKMSTNEDTLLVVQGLRSNDSVWENVQSMWEIDHSLQENIYPPQLSEIWIVSPVFTGTGWIRVSLNIDSVTIPDTIPVVFTQGKPISVKLDLITPEHLRIAGDTITAVAKIYNKDGLVPGLYCFSDKYENIGVKYYDPVDNEMMPDPEIIFDSLSTLLGNGAYNAISRSQCFFNGVDTIKFILYYAPFDKDSTHQIIVNLGLLEASSSRFHLLASRLDSMAIEYVNRIPLGDTIVLHYPDDAAYLVTTGFDRFGNRRGDEISTWNNIGNLHPIWKPQHVSRVFYSSSDVLSPEYGYIKAVTDDSTSLFKDSLYVIIKGPMIRLKSAHTADYNGNGYLDRIVMHFSKSVDFKLDNSDLSLTCRDFRFSVNSIRKDTIHDSIWTLFLQEDSTIGQLQTDWCPTISFGAMDSIAAVNEMLCADGAGPVIISVTKTIEKSGDRTKDHMIVHFSEPVRDQLAGRISYETPLTSTFRVWEEKNGQYAEVNLLQGINNFHNITDDRVEFYMLNGADISSNHFFNINHLSGVVGDNAIPRNIAVEENRRVRVIVNKADESISVFPNPSSATFYRVPAGIFLAENETNAREWILQDNAGTIINIKINVPEEGKIKAVVKIYDAIGNMVNRAVNSDLTASVPKGINDYDINFYWNGSSKSGYKVAPGVYRVVANIINSSSKYKGMRYTGLIGIRK